MIVLAGSVDNSTAIGKLNAPIAQYLRQQESLAVKNSKMPIIFPYKNSDNWAEGYGGRTSSNSRFKSSGENAPYPESKTQDDWTKTIENQYDWLDMYRISRRMVQDNQFNIEDSSDIIVNYHRTIEEYGAAFLANAASTTFVYDGVTYQSKVGDGGALFAIDHESKTKGYKDQTNSFDGTLTDESLTVLEGQMKGQRDANGDLLGLQPDTIIIPCLTRADTLQKRKLYEILNATGNPESTDRAGVFNAGRYTVVEWEYLNLPSGATAGSTFFFLCDSNYMKKTRPFVHQVRSELTTRSYIENNTGALVWASDSREVIEPGSSWQGTLMVSKGLSGTSIASL
jgi:hypothetical protein